MGPSSRGDPFGEAPSPRRARFARPMSSTATGEGEATTGGEPPPSLLLSGAVVGAVPILLLLRFLLLSWLRPAFRRDLRVPVGGVLPPRLVALLPLPEGIASVEDEVEEALDHTARCREQGDEALRLAVTKM